MTPQKESWHLDRKVPLGLIFAMLTQGAMMIWAIADIKKDVEVLKAQTYMQRERDEQQDKAQRERDDQQDKAQTRQLSVVTGWLERMDSKLDRLIEKRK